MSEGEITDDQARQERVLRQRNKFMNNIMTRDNVQSNNNTATLNRRVISNDRERLDFSNILKHGTKTRRDVDRVAIREIGLGEGKRGRRWKKGKRGREGE